MLDAVIIGAGPAGIASAIYLKRAGLDICILEKKRVGGLLHNAYLVENVPFMEENLGRYDLEGYLRRPAYGSAYLIGKIQFDILGCNPGWTYDTGLAGCRRTTELASW